MCPDKTELLAGLLSLARRAGDALPLEPEAPIAALDKAGKANYVTRYDRQTQELVFGGCRALVPDAVLIGEESYENGDQAPDPAGLSRCFIIDPIDGTTNFIRGYRHSSISIAYAEHGRIELGVVYDPWQQELFWAEKDGGAFVQHGIQPAAALHAASEDLAHSLVCFGSSPYYPELQKATFSSLQALFPHIADIRRSGSAALDLAYVAAGRTDAFFELRLSPWDYAAGSLMVTEAGGRITSADGSPLRFDHSCSVLAGSKAVYESVRACMPVAL